MPELHARPQPLIVTLPLLLLHPGMLVAVAIMLLVNKRKSSSETWPQKAYSDSAAFIGEGGAGLAIPLSVPHDTLPGVLAASTGGGTPCVYFLQRLPCLERRERKEGALPVQQAVCAERTRGKRERCAAPCACNPSSQLQSLLPAQGRGVGGREGAEPGLGATAQGSVRDAVAEGGQGCLCPSTARPLVSSAEALKGPRESLVLCANAGSRDGGGPRGGLQEAASTSSSSPCPLSLCFTRKPSPPRMPQGPPTTPK